MFSDKDADVREHAAFAITQSKSPRVAQDLTRLGNTDKEGDVRAQAWFWLAQTGAAEAEIAIGAALKQGPGRSTFASRRSSRSRNYRTSAPRAR